MSNTIEVKVPDIGDFKDVEVIEVLVKPGDRIQPEDLLLTLESDKASMDIPSPLAGTVVEIKTRVGERVSEGSLILMLEAAGANATARDSKTQEPPLSVASPASTPAPEAASPVSAPAPAPRPSVPPTANLPPVATETSGSKPHASPTIRRFARELGVDLRKISGSGPKGRILKEDVQGFVKRSLSQGSHLPGMSPMPTIDFREFGEIETQPLTKINRLTGQNLHRNWVNIPHVTQFDEADITELDAFRRSLVTEYERKNVKITFLTFLLKAVVSALKEHPRVNASLDASGEQLILKRYYHIGVAVDTPDGLVVPVIRDVDRKSIVELAHELQDVSDRARQRKLKAIDLQGGCFTISSLGGIGGTQFTPIINAPEVAILGISRARMQPVWQDGEFIPRLILPLSLSYDHRVIDGALGARFTHCLSGLLSDMRRMLL